MSVLEGYEPHVFPSDDDLANLETWTVLDEGAPLLGVVRGFFWIEARPRLVEGPPEAYGPYEAVRTESASRRLSANKSRRVVSTTSAKREIVRNAAASFQLPNVMDAVRAAVGVGFPTVGAAKSVASVAKLEVSNRKAAEVSGTITIESTEEWTDEIEISPETDPVRYICPKYRVYEAIVYLERLDYLIVDYSTGRKKVLPTQDRPPRPFVRDVAAGANEAPCRVRLGTLRHYEQTSYPDVLTEPPEVAVKNPDVVHLQCNELPAAVRLPRAIGTSLYEIARGGRRLPKTRDEVLRRLRDLGALA